MDTSERTPELEILKGFEELEALKLTAEDGRILATASFSLAFGALVIHSPAIARKVKDSLVAGLKQSGLSPRLLEWLEQHLLGLCDKVEKWNKI